MAQIEACGVSSARAADGSNMTAKAGTSPKPW